MATCENKLFKNITSTCETKISAGVEQKIYLLNRTDIDTITYDSENPNKVTNITLKSGKNAYVAQGFKRNMTCGFERVVSDDNLDSWTDTLNLTAFEFDSESARNLNEMSDVVAIVDRKGTKQDDGSILILGLENGLFCSADTWAAFENNGSRQLTFSSMADSGESQPYYNYAVQTGSPAADSYSATISALEAMLAD